MALAPARTISEVLADFLSDAPSMEEIATYRLPDDVQDHARELLAKQRAGTLSVHEQAEMDEFRYVDHLLSLMQAKARLKLKVR